MKTRQINFFASMLVVAITTTLLFSCSDDDDDKGPDNSFTVDGTKVTIKTTVFGIDPTASESPVDGEPYHRHYIYLLDPGYTVNENNGSLSGSGNLITLAISGASINLDPGTYEFTGMEENPKAYELWDGRLDFNSSEYIFSNATLEVGKSGNNFTIEFTATAYPPDENESWLPDLTQTPKAISGSFSGPIISIEE